MKLKYVFIWAFAAVLFACGGEAAKKETPAEAPAEKAAAETVDPMSNKGIGPISAVTLGDIDQDMVAKGETVFKAKCTACHKISKKFIGPSLKGITERRTPEWIMNMVMNPEEMIQKDPIAKQLLIEYNGAPMANQNISEDEARALLEYFRTKN